MNIYIDESGDLGFTFNKPFREGGSSRYLTIAFLLTPQGLSHLPKRIVRSLYNRKKRSTKNEIKGTQLTLDDKVFFSKKVVRLLTQQSKIKVFSITVDKRKVKPHIRQDANKLYNYMIGLVLPDRIKRHPKVTFIPDKRSIKVQSGNSLADYLKIKLWFDLNSTTIIENNPQESHKVLNLQFIDFIAHILWKKYEDKELKAYNILKKKVELTHLFCR